MPNQKSKSKKKPAASFRLDAAVHNRLRRHAKIRNVSNTELLTELINGLDRLTAQRAGSAQLESAALACILALDLLKMRDPPPQLIAAAAFKLEELLLCLEGGQGS
jgi:hypothetical protein